MLKLKTAAKLHTHTHIYICKLCPKSVETQVVFIYTEMTNE